jgi:hypothetical protein
MILNILQRLDLQPTKDIFTYGNMENGTEDSSNI